MGNVMMKVVAYRRVSTQAQGKSGLGLEAQEGAIAAYVVAKHARVVGTFTEIESGKNNERPQLTAALHHARVTGATLVIAKLDRLSRNAAFLLTLRDSGVKFVAADLPDANDLTVGILAVVAQQEREAISQRTKDALKVARSRIARSGQRRHPHVKRLGNPNGAAAIRRAGKGNGAACAKVRIRAEQHAKDLAPVVAAISAEGPSTLCRIAN